ncbi:hypothetical protein K491DRAFT_712888 [Lophiostoma macrostomum CBS 122681]|uniref:Apple domain-containing protein n=1 Tax=Lophiostoma macrostomum CBS 122681 TaxID=1314788 RepID=A0A6A6THA4_9PLEO|nr:hypothetical protein K491DRAFT_712888 [Lophiostoma macrostomum CBS 122681]
MDIFGNDMGGVGADTIEDCIEQCTRNTKACYGIVWIEEDKVCLPKGASTSYRSLSPKINATAVLNIPYQVEQDMNDIICPYPNLSTQKTRNGLEFQILCGANLSFDDLLSPLTDSESEMHANSLLECLENCAKLHPLCTRVTYNADRNGGSWLNCWLKQGVTSKATPDTRLMVHSAYALVPNLERNDCRNGSLVQVQGSETRFRLSCNDFRRINGTVGSIPQSYHEKSLQDCADRCGNKGSTCVAAVFDHEMWSGFQNCYLFDKMPGPGEQNSNYTFAYLDSLSSQYLAPPPKPAEISGKSWMAGIITPAIVIPALAGFYWYWARMRKSKKA